MIYQSWIVMTPDMDFHGAQWMSPFDFRDLLRPPSVNHVFVVNMSIWCFLCTTTNVMIKISSQRQG